MREFLKELELNNEGDHLTKELIDKIMAEHGKSITTEKEKVSSLETKINELENASKENKKTIDDLNKTIEENNKSLENMQNVTNENNELKSQLKLKDNQLIINDSSVKKEFREFVTDKVSSQVNDETDFATALESYKKDNPQYFGETVVKKVQTAPTLNGGSTQPATTNDIMNNITIIIYPIFS